jgi:RNA polymerase sigma-70 factor, ECF subfamily
VKLNFSQYGEPKFNCSTTALRINATFSLFVYYSKTTKMDISDEKRLIARARKDPAAFGEIFDAYYDPIFGYVLRRVGSVHIAQDIVSETFFKALDRLWQFRWRNVSISSWLYRIATNETNQYFRRKNKAPRSLDALLEESGFELQSEVDIEEEVLEQERELARAEDWQNVRKNIELLPEKYQEVLTLRYFENKKVREIAEIVNKKEGTVKSLLSRAVSRLREQCNQKDTAVLYLQESKDTSQIV